MSNRALATQCLSSRRTLLRLPLLAILVAALLSGANQSAASARPAHQEEYSPYTGLVLASADASGHWTGRWLGAHPYHEVDGTVVVDMAAASWAELRSARGALGAQPAYLLGDFPYVGDGMCYPGAIRRWWGLPAAPLPADALTLTPAAVDPTAPSLPCPVNLQAAGPLLLQPAGDQP